MSLYPALDINKAVSFSTTLKSFSGSEAPCEELRHGNQGTHLSVDSVTTATQFAQTPFWSIPLLLIHTESPSREQNRPRRTQIAAWSMVANAWFTSCGTQPWGKESTSPITADLSELDDHRSPTSPDRKGQQQRMRQSQHSQGEFHTFEPQVRKSLRENSLFVK